MSSPVYNVEAVIIRIGLGVYMYVYIYHFSSYYYF